MVQLVSRADWGARPATDRTPLVASQVRGVAIHYSAAEADRRADHAECAGRVRAIQRYHQDVRGWADIAYSYLACNHGWLFEGRGLLNRPASQGTNAGNDGYLSACFLGADRDGRRDVSDAGLIALGNAVLLVRGKYPQAMAVLPHSAFKATECPGDELRLWITRGTPRPVAPTPAQPVGGVGSSLLFFRKGNDPEVFMFLGSCRGWVPTWATLQAAWTLAGGKGDPVVHSLPVGHVLLALPILRP